MMLQKTMFWMFLSLFLIGCSNQSLEAMEEDEWIMEETGAFLQIIHIETNENDAFTRFYFEGENIRIPYEIVGMSEGIYSEFGLIFMVDGVASQTQLEFSNGVIFREASYMHDFSLAYGEGFVFDVVFMPISTEIEQTVAISDIAIFSPNAIPMNADEPDFFSSNTIVSTYFIEMETKMDAEHIIGNEKQGYHFTDFEAIAPVIHTFHRPWLREGETMEELFDEAARLMIFPQDVGLQVGFQDSLFVEDEELLLTLLVYGGQEVRSRITFFINHRPVLVNGYDFIELEIRKGEMAVIDIELTQFYLESFNSLYAIMVPIGQDYVRQNIHGSRPLLIVRE